MRWPQTGSYIIGKLEIKCELARFRAKFAIVWIYVVLAIEIVTTRMIWVGLIMLRNYRAIFSCIFSHRMFVSITAGAGVVPSRISSSATAGKAVV
jgi:hypothetical protein